MKADSGDQSASATDPSPDVYTGDAGSGNDVCAALPEERLAALRSLFKSERFNRIDGLADYAGDFHSFEELGPTITADMRHQMERRGVAAGETAGSQGDSQKDPARRSEERPVERHRPPPIDPPLEHVVLVSNGRALIVGLDEEQVMDCGRQLSRNLRCTLVVDQAAQPDPSPQLVNGLPLMRVQAVRVQGSLGRFAADFSVGGGARSLDEIIRGEEPAFDLVLDLRPDPPDRRRSAGRRLPFGYFAPGGDPAELQAALRELPEMTGAFEKPQFVHCSRELCVHRRAGFIACRLCLDACPCEAIRQAGDGIEIDHLLCQGCGVCEAVCPTAAVRLLHPALGDLVALLQKELSSRKLAGERATTVVFHEARALPSRYLSQANGWSEPLLWFEVDDIGRIGVEILLAAIASGASRVVVWPAETAAATETESVQRQARMAGIILEGLGHSADRVQVADGVIPLESSVAPESAPAADLSLASDKRSLLQIAVQHLLQHSPRAASEAGLPSGASYGEVRLSGNTCTLCMACAGVCPTQALTAGGASPSLRFTESRCAQCGACAKACPEQAIVLIPRLVFEIKTAGSTRILAEAEPFHCIRCGTAFASRVMIEHMTARLAGHWMYRRSQDFRRLHMCGTCRVREIFSVEGDES